MDARGYRLAVDFGTSNTVAMLAWPDGHVRPLLFDGSPTLPSSVYADPHTGLLVGRDAVHAARISPERFEPNPKRRIDEPAVLLGEAEIGTADLIAAVLARVAGEARRVSGGQLGQVTITCPVAWAQTRRGVLMSAAERAGLGQVALLPEPVAAASVFFTLSETTTAPGSAFVVYDLGAGTFDASVVRLGPGGFEVLSAEGLSTSGGLDIDAAIVAYLGATYATRDPGTWNRLVHPTTSAERRANRLLWDDVRSAKEMLSRTSATMIHLPMYDEDAPLGRDQFELLARPILAATVTATRAAIASAQLSLADVAGVFLVGGGSRIPLVATLLHQALGKAPTAVEQPELVVAQGGVGAPMSGPATDGPPVSGAPVSAPAAYGSPTSAPPAYGPPTSAPPAYGPGPSGSGSPRPEAPSPARGYSVPEPQSPGYGFPATGAPSSAAVSGPPSSAVPMSAVPMSAVPMSPGPMPSAPVSPAFAAAPVSGHPAPPPPAPGRDRPPAGRANVPPPPNVYGGTLPAQPGAPRRGRRGVLVAVVVAVLLAIGLGAYGISKLGNADNSGSGQNPPSQDQSQGDSQDSEPVAADVDHSDTDWQSTAAEYDGNEGKTIAYQCPSDGTIGTVWGSGPYTTDSSVCTAAVHAGYISLADGGRVVVKIQTGLASYEASNQHDILTAAYDKYDWAFEVVG